MDDSDWNPTLFQTCWKKDNATIDLKTMTISSMFVYTYTTDINAFENVQHN